MRFPVVGQRTQIFLDLKGRSVILNNRFFLSVEFSRRRPSVIFTRVRFRSFSSQEKFKKIYEDAFAAWAIRSCIRRVRCGTIPIMRSISMSWPR